MVNINGIFRLVMASLSLLAGTGCVKSTKPKPDLGDYHPPVALSDYCFFKPGTWWLYQDSISGAKDSVYVIAGNMQSYKTDNGEDYTGTFHRYYTKTKDGSGNIREYSVNDEGSIKTSKCCGGRYFCGVAWNKLPVQIVPDVNYAAYTYIFNSFDAGVTGGTGNGEQCWARGTLASIQINNMTFNNLVIFETSVNIPDNNNNLHPYRFKNFISKYVGVVKRIDLDSNRTWLLTSYHIAN